MAKVDFDEDQEPFINVTRRTGATGDWDDLLVVQTMLYIIYEISPDVRNPLKEPIAMTGKPSKETVILITDFQKSVMKRVKPDGCVDKAIGAKKSASTIWRLNAHANVVLTALHFPDLITAVRRMHPRLEARLIPTLPTVVIKG